MHLICISFWELINDTNEHFSNYEDRYKLDTFSMNVAYISLSHYLTKLTH